MKQLVTSGFLTADLRDIVRGLAVAVLTPVFTVAIESLQAGSLTFDWKHIAVTALVAALSYILKNVLTPHEIVVTGISKEQAAAVRSGEATTEIVAK